MKYEKSMKMVVKFEVLKSMMILFIFNVQIFNTPVRNCGMNKHLNVTICKFCL